jgi:hypothetical protein
MDQKRLGALLRKLNRSAVTPFGRIPLERLVAKNIDDLSTLRSSGLTWPPIERALVDWRRDDDRPLSVDHLRSAYSRARRHKGTEIRAARQAASRPEPQDTGRTLTGPPEPKSKISTTENLDPAVQPSKLRERTSSTLKLRNIEED